MRRGFLLFTLFASLACGAVSQEINAPFESGIDDYEYSYVKPEPDWVVPVDPVNASDAQYPANQGKRRLLIAKQKHVDGPESGLYNRNVLQLLSPKAVNAAGSLKVSFDPTYQHVRVHRFNIIRGDEVIDALETAYFEKLRDEKRLSSNIFQGRMSLYVRVNDLRPNDVVDYSYTIFGDNPASRGEFSAWFWKSYFHPVERLFIHASWPAELDVLTYDGDLPDAAITEGARESYSYGPIAVPRQRNERGAPRGFSANRQIQISSFKDWSEVNDTVRPYFEEPSNNHKFEQKIEQIKSDYTSFEDRMTAAIRFVQDDIRYQAITLGLGGWRPYNPSLIMDRRFGDCKDKSLLLVRFARAFGAEHAHVALVHTRRGAKLPDELPSMYQFNHAIAYIVHDNKTHWIDGTVSQTGGSWSTLEQANFKNALILAPNENALTPMPIPSPEAPEYVLNVVYDASAGSEAPISLDGNVSFKNTTANAVRRTFLSRGEDFIAEGILSGLEKQFGDVDDVTISGMIDDRHQNTINYSWSTQLLDPYETPIDGSEQDLEFTYELFIPFKLANQWSRRARKLPLDITEGLNIRVVRTTLLPEGTNIDLGAELLTPLEVSNDAFEYSRTVEAIDDQVVSTVHLKTKVDMVPAAQAAEIFKDIRRMERIPELTLKIPAPTT